MRNTARAPTMLHPKYTSYSMSKINLETMEGTNGKNSEHSKLFETYLNMMIIIPLSLIN